MTADAAGTCWLNRRSTDPAGSESIIRARLFPLLVGFSSGPMSGHVNVIHGFDPAKGEVVAMEPWFPDPSKDLNFQMLSTGGVHLLLQIKEPERRLFSQERTRGDHWPYYTTHPFSTGQFVVAIPASLSFP